MTDRRKAYGWRWLKHVLELDGTSGMRTTDRAAAGSTRSIDAPGETLLPKRDSRPDGSTSESAAFLEGK
jgi:hypothetical protein